MTDINPEPRIYRASSLGYSLCQLVCPHLGYEPLPTPDWLQAKFDEGTALEQPILDQLMFEGWEISRQQEEINIEIIPGHAIIQGHIDGVGTINGNSRVVEVKTMAASTWDKVNRLGWEAGGIIEKYKWQLSAYGLGIGLPGVLVAYNKETKEMLSLVMNEPFYLISDLANKVLAAEKLVREGTIPEGCTDYPCPYVYLHGEKETPDPADEELDALLDEWLVLDQKVKTIERDKAALRKVIIELQGEISGKVKGSQGVTVATTWVPGKEVSYFKSAAWVTTISGPRGKRDNVAE